MQSHDTDTHSIRSVIEERERTLLKAFTACDTAVIGDLLHADVVYVIPNGHMLTKSKVLHNYDNGGTAINSMNAEHRHVNVFGDTAVVSMILHLKGKYYDQVVDRRFLYTRVWKLFDGQWKVISISSVPVIE